MNLDHKQKTLTAVVNELDSQLATLQKTAKDFRQGIISAFIHDLNYLMNHIGQPDSYTRIRSIKEKYKIILNKDFNETSI